MKRFLFLLLPALLLYGADINGKWTGTVEVTDPNNGDKVSTAVKVEFTQNADTVAGKIGRMQDTEPDSIRNGHLAGKALTFEVRSAETDSVMKFELALVTDDRLEGSMNGNLDIGAIKGKVVLTRAR